MVNNELTDSGHPWTIVNSAPKIVNGTLGSDGYGSLHIVTLDNTLTNYVIRYDAIALNPNLGVVLRYKDKTHFYVVSLSNTSVFLRVYNGSATSSTIVASTAIPWTDTGVKMAIQVSGNTIRVYTIIADEQTQIFSSSKMVNFTGYNKIGFYAWSSTTQNFDNFEVGLT